MPETKDTLTTNHVQTLKQILTQSRGFIEKAKKIDPTLTKDLEQAAATLDTRLKNLEERIASLPLTDEKYTRTKADLVNLFNESKKVAAQAEKDGPKPLVTFQFQGNDEATEEETVAFIKTKLPASGHGNISQALSDAVLGRGKATPLSGVKHASAGPKQKGKGCTLFFKRGDGDIEIVAIGQHEDVPKGSAPKYTIHFSSVTGIKKGGGYSL